MVVRRRQLRKLLTRILSLGLVSLLILGPANRSFSQPITIPVVSSSGDVIGNIVVDAVGLGIEGGFSSTVGDPVSLEDAYAAAHEDHFNWYQIVVFDPFPLVDPKGNRLSPPYVDVPPGGYGDNPETIADEKLWGDEVPWYWNEGDDPPAGTPGFQDGLNIADKREDLTSIDGIDDTLRFADFPKSVGNIGFKTWLVSLNADGSFDSWHGGFFWDWSPGGIGVTNITPITGPPTAAEYDDIIGGFQKNVPEPSTFILLAIGIGSFAIVRRRHFRAADGGAS